MFLAAALQLRSNADTERNFVHAARWIRRAAEAGAALIATPENTTFLGPPGEKVARAEPIDGPLHRRFGELARELRVHLLVGSVAERPPPSSSLPPEGGGVAPEGGMEAQRCYNTSLLFGPDGELLGFYRKIHLFDIDIPGGPRFVESATIAPGADPVVVRTALGTIGLSVCYDLRFPELYRRLVEQGATILAVPSAFTRATGRDHWHVLLRARAIEAQAFVIAPAQEGRHDDEGPGGAGVSPAGQRESYGHSLIADPWGTVLAECADGEGMALALVDPDRVTAVRRGMPLAAHRRL